MNELTARQEEILKQVIESYIESSVPVGSRVLSDRHQGMHLSSASIRNEMGILERAGYLTHPHTSAGRVPTDKGYQFYVKQVVREEPLSETLTEFIGKEMQGKFEDLDSLMERTSQILSAMAREAVLVSTPQLKELYFKELSLIPMDETRLWTVWCTTSGFVQSCLVEMHDLISSEELDRIRNFINEELAGEAIESLRDKLVKKIETRRDSLRRLYEQALQIVLESLPQWRSPRLYIEGSRYLATEPEFQDVKKRGLLMAALEQKANWVQRLLGSVPMEGVHVAIGAQGLSKDVWDCSLVSASYIWQGKYLGALGILGPRRMRYGKMMALVHQMAQEISLVLEKWSG